jgi:methylated-DNA-[protein]-cysteine S-methyltransferase
MKKKLKIGVGPQFPSKSGFEPDFQAVIEFPKMMVAVATREGRVAGIRYLPPDADLVAPRNALAERAARQLERYREDPDAKFDLPLLIEGTEFQRRLWDALREIPRGRTLTYGELARKLGGEARAVGQACGDNRLPIVIPCHRVVAADGIGGFSHSTGGYLIEAKRWLLMHESSADAFQLTS